MNFPNSGYLLPQPFVKRIYFPNPISYYPDLGLICSFFNMLCHGILLGLINFIKTNNYGNK